MLLLVLVIVMKGIDHEHDYEHEHAEDVVIPSKVEEPRGETFR
jgi:hypothetical protein